MTGQMTTTSRQPLERTAKEARVVHMGVETLWMDQVGCIPFSVRDANAWAPIDYNHPARVVLYRVQNGSAKDLGLHPINGGPSMKFPQLHYEADGDKLKAILGDPVFG